jgi:hypothetical protein
MNADKLLKRYRIDDPDRFHLADVDPADTAEFDFDKHGAEALMAADIDRLRDLQERLYAGNEWSC